jgi:hypothetical protein
MVADFLQPDQVGGPRPVQHALGAPGASLEKPVDQVCDRHRMGTCTMVGMPRKGISVSLTYGSPDEVLDALDALSSALEAAAADQQVMADEVVRMRRCRAWRQPWLSALPPAGQPNLVSLSTRALSSLGVATARVRTTLARALRTEGLTVREIAALFGVSHQRVSELLARTDHPREMGDDGPATTPIGGQGVPGLP